MISHPFKPVYNEKSRILILGSFPSVKSREQMFFYGHKNNRFWRIVSDVLGQKTPTTVKEKRSFLLRNGIALWDVIASCEISGSSDSSIKNVVANDIGPILQAANIRTIIVNGKTAKKYYDKYIFPVVNIAAVVLPSTSSANAAYSYERLLECWKIFADE